MQCVAADNFCCLDCGRAKGPYVLGLNARCLICQMHVGRERGSLPA
jgi:hypothetical protein